MGDLMHALPALTDACAASPGISFDWVVDESFAEVPSWHPAVRNIFKSAHRRWRREFWRFLRGGEFRDFYRDLNAHEYDAVIDGQNNVKSSFISFLRRGKVHGMDRASVAEQPAWWAYKYRHSIDRNQHAITRQRQLFARALGYAMPEGAPVYGLRPGAFRSPLLAIGQPYLVLVHNASWTTKLWPEEHWHALIRLAGNAGYHVVLPGGSESELTRAAQLAARHDNATALPRMSLSELGGVIQAAAGAVCCDTGLAHLAAMIGTPAVTLYGPTSSTLIGTTGSNQVQLAALAPPFTCAPCYKRRCSYRDGMAMSACMEAFSPETAWENLRRVMAATTRLQL